MRHSLTAKTALAAAMIAMLFAPGCVNFGGNLPAKAQRSEQLTSPVSGITTLDVYSEVGRIVLETADVAEASIIADVTVRSKTDEEAQNLVDQVRITAEQSGPQLVVRAVKPSGFDRNQLCVDFTISAPAHLAVQCATNVGDIQVDGFAGRVTAKTDVGRIEATQVRSMADCHTNVGDIRLAYAPDAPARTNASAKTNVGSIDITLGDSVSAEVDARVNVGSIETQRSLTISGRIGKSLNGSIGDGEGRIRLETNVGSIRIH
jgi:hypothetical protein